MTIIIKACVILHNLTIELERMHSLDLSYIDNVQYRLGHPFTVVERLVEDRANMSRAHMQIILEDLWSQVGLDNLKCNLIVWLHIFFPLAFFPTNGQGSMSSILNVAMI